MTFTDEAIRIEPGHFQRTWQSCNYFVGDTELFHERLYHTNLYGKGGFLSRILGAKSQAERDAIANEPEHTEQWLPGGGTKAEIEALAARHGGFAHEEHYPADEANPGYFLAFNDTDKALAFCRTEDFDKLCATMAKLP